VPRIPTKIQSAARPGPGGALPATRTPGPYQSRERFSVRALNRTQTAAQQATAKATNRFDADNNVLADVTFVATTITPLQHGLGRAYQGAHLVNPRGGYLAYQVLPNTDPRMDAHQVQIICQHNVTADVVVY
jgi:hypothetical protein